MKNDFLLRKITLVLSLIPVFIGLMVLLGWKLDIASLQSIFPNQITMKANTAIGMILCGGSIALLLCQSRPAFCRYVAMFISLIVLIIAIFTLSQSVFQFNLGIDEALVTDKTSQFNMGRMSPTTAFCFINIAICIMLAARPLSLRLRKPIIGALSITVIIISCAIFFSYLPNMLWGYHILKNTSMGIHTALALMMLGLALFLLIYSEENFIWSLNLYTTVGSCLALILIIFLTDTYHNITDQICQHDANNITIAQNFLISPLSTFFLIALLAIGISIFNVHVQSRKKMEAIYRKLAEIVDSSNDGIISKNLNGIVTSWNIGAEHIFGYTAKEMIGQSISILFPSDRINEEHEIMKHIVNGDKIEHFETIRKRKDGKPINVSVTISPLKNAKNEIVGASTIVRDITENKRLEQQLRQSNKMGAVGQLAGGIAHDFNNLLGIIIGNLDLLIRSAAGNESMMNRANTALKAATRGADLTKRLLAFSRQQPLTSKPSNLNDSVNNVVEMASQLLGNDIQIKTELSPSLPLVLMDASELESALLNLAVNARDAMPEGGKLMISTQLRQLDDKYPTVQTREMSSGVYAAISMTDTGHGMPPEILEHVYEPFFTTKERGKGTGMGLSMVYGFAKQSGGSVKIYSEVGHGTTVTIYLPLADTIPLPNKTISFAPKTHGSVKVLVVDDEPDLLEIASLYLKEMGHEVYQATDGNSALEMFSRTPEISVLVTDIVMPGGMNGIELAKKIRQLNANIIVIYVSGFPLVKLTENESTKMEEDSYFLSKPYQHEEFINTIKQILNN